MAAKRGRETLRDMALSLGVIVAIVAAFVLLQPRRHYDARKPVPVDTYSGEVRAAQRLARPATLLAPGRLPAGWTATSVTASAAPTAGGRFSFHVGYVTPSVRYAHLEVGDGPADALVGAAVGASSVLAAALPVGSQTWVERSGTEGLALTRTEAGVTYVVAGAAKGGAGIDELTFLAGSLTPDPALPAPAVSPS